MPEYDWIHKIRKAKGLEPKGDEETALSIPSQLYNLGIDDPAIINQAADNYMKTGILTIPTSKTTRTMGGPVIDTVNSDGIPVSQFPETVVETKPVRLGKSVATWNEQTGDVTPVELPSNTSFLKVKPGKEPPSGATAYFYDAATGAVKSSKPISGAKDQFIPIGSKPSGAATSPQSRADEIIMRGYEALKRQKDIMGQPIPIDPAYTAEYLAARKRSGLPPPAEEGEKPLTPEAARQFLNQAGGDKNKARELARQAGYTF